MLFSSLLAPVDKNVTGTAGIGGAYGSCASGTRCTDGSSKGANRGNIDYFLGTATTATATSAAATGTIAATISKHAGRGARGVWDR
jgi:hypothetical protein